MYALGAVRQPRYCSDSKIKCKALSVLEKRYVNTNIYFLYNKHTHFHLVSRVEVVSPVSWRMAECLKEPVSTSRLSGATCRLKLWSR